MNRSHTQYIEEWLLNISYITFEDFCNLTWICDWELNWQVVLDIWALINDIWVRLARWNPQWNFFHIDPVFMHWVNWIKESVITTLSWELNHSSELLSLLDSKNQEKEQLILEETKKYVDRVNILSQYYKDVEKWRDKNITRIWWVWEVLPIREWKVDKIIVSWFLYKAKRLDLIMTEIHRVLNNNWKLIIVDYNINNGLEKYFKQAWLTITKKWESFFCIKLNKWDVLKFKKTIEENDVNTLPEDILLDENSWLHTNVMRKILNILLWNNIKFPTNMFDLPLQLIYDLRNPTHKMIEERWVPPMELLKLVSPLSEKAYHFYKKYI